MLGPSVLWFRHGLRLHDNPALLDAIKISNDRPQRQFIAIFIFDGESGGTKTIGYNRMQFLLESLHDLNRQFHNFGGQLYVFQDKPVNVFRHLWTQYNISSIHFEQDCEPIWRARDMAVIKYCTEVGITVSESVSHTLWNPYEVIKANGGIPPTTYEMFLVINMS